jgi:uncharacterized protein DUF4249
MKYRYPVVTCFLLIAAATLFSCRKPYIPPAISATNSYLVVEGEISSGADSTVITLSRTVKISAKTTLNPETNAMVAIESDQNVSYPLVEFKPGSYTVAGLNLDKTRIYRLSIQTSNGRKYQSDYVPVVDAPPIDSLTFDGNGGPTSGPGMNVYVNTHDASGQVKYFSWSYTETWQFHSAFESLYYSNGDTVLHRNFVNDDIYDCYRGDTSTTFVLGTSAKLSKSIIANQPVAFVPSTSEKVSVKYSILVKQSALTADAYNFYSELKKNTEQLGSIFDAQPSELQGNIHCISNPLEPVIGYVSVGATSSLRLFVRQSQLPFWVPVTYYTTSNCALVHDPLEPKESCCLYQFHDDYGVTENQVDEYINYNIDHYYNPFIPVDPIGVPEQPPIGYTAGTRDCVDCTLRGSNHPPSFWK